MLLYRYVMDHAHSITIVRLKSVKCFSAPPCSVNNLKLYSFGQAQFKVFLFLYNYMKNRTI